MLSKSKELYKSILNLKEDSLYLMILFLGGVFIVPFSKSFASQASLIAFYVAFAVFFAFVFKKMRNEPGTEKRAVKSSLIVLSKFFFLSAVLSAMFNPSFSYSFFAKIWNSDSILNLSLFVFSFIIIVHNSKSSFFDKALKVLQAVFLLNFLYFILNIFSSGKFLATASATAIASPIELSLLAALVFVLSILQDAHSSFSKVLKYSSIALSLLALVFINFGIAWTVSFAGLTLAAYLKFKKKPDTKLLAIYAGAFISLLFILFGAFFYSYIYKYTGITFSDLKPSLLSSIEVMQNTQSQSLLNRILGTGPASFSYDWFAYKSNALDNLGALWNTSFAYSANTVTHFLTVFGLLGGSLWLLILLSIFSYIFRFQFESKYKRALNSAIANSYIALFALSVAFLLYTPSWLFMFIFFVFLANFLLTLKERALLKDISVKLKYKKYICFSVVFTLLALSAYVAFASLLNNSLYALAAKGSADAKQIEKYISVAKYFYPVRSQVYSDLATLSNERIKNELIALGNKEEKPGQKTLLASLADDRVRYLKAATAYNPRDFRLWLALAEAELYKYSITKDEEDYNSAKQAVAKAGELAPLQPLVYYTQSHLAAAKNDYANAQNALLYSINLKPDFGPAYTALYDLALVQNNLKGAVQVAQLALRNNPRDLVAWKRLAVAFLNNKQYKEAEATAKSALLRYPENTPIDQELLQIYALASIKQDRKEEALKFLEAYSKKHKDQGLMKFIKSLKALQAKGSADKEAGKDKTEQEVQGEDLDKSESKGRD